MILARGKDWNPTGEAGTRCHRRSIHPWLLDFLHATMPVRSGRQPTAAAGGGDISASNAGIDGRAWGRRNDYVRFIAGCWFPCRGPQARWRTNVSLVFSIRRILLASSAAAPSNETRIAQAPVAERSVALPPENQGADVSCHCYSNHNCRYSNHHRRRALSAAPRLS